MEFIDPKLPRHLTSWHSEILDLDMPIAHYGDRGHPLLLYPTAQADYLENERFFLVKAIEPYIFAGRCQVFCIESINKHAWMAELPVVEQARRQALYSRYVEEEVVGFIRERLGDDEARIAVSGASFGAFHAANQFFRRPAIFDTLIAMSGFFDLGPSYTGDFCDDNVYFNNPAAFLSNLEDPELLRTLRSDCDIHIVTGQGKWEAPHRSRQLSEILWEKRIPHNLDMWGYDVDHDWPWWRRMLSHYIAEHVSW